MFFIFWLICLPVRIFSLTREDLYLLSLGIEQNFPGEKKENYLYCKNERKRSKGILYIAYTDCRQECYVIGDLEKRKANNVSEDLRGL